MTNFAAAKKRLADEYDLDSDACSSSTRQLKKLYGKEREDKEHV